MSEGFDFTTSVDGSNSLHLMSSDDYKNLQSELSVNKKRLEIAISGIVKLSNYGCPICFSESNANELLKQIEEVKG